jgi:glucose/mannose transport system permease protein
MCGYVFAQYRFRFDNVVFIFVVSAIFLPYQAILVPLFQTIRSLGLYDSVWGLILAHTAYGIPMTTLMFRSFYGDIPQRLIQQATLDGYGPWEIYRKIVLPSTKIATVTAAVFQFASIWNELVFALVLTGNDAMPATVSLNQMMGTLAAEWNVQMAGSMWLALPVLILYIVMGKYLIRGYMAGSVAAS